MFRRSPHHFALFIYLIVLVCCLSAPTIAIAGGAIDDPPPAWLRQASVATTPVYRKDVPAVVLHDEQIVTVGEDGRMTTVTSYAVRILTREGRRAATARASYLTDTGKVREMKAWLLRPGGEAKRYGKDETADVAIVDNDVYNEVRLKIISAGDDAEVGTVFGYQVTSEDRSVFTQNEWGFQGRYPTLLSRYTVILPANWRAESVTFNHARIEPTVTGSTYTWELRDLAPIEPESHSPAVTNLAPRVAVSYFPAANGTRALGPSFSNWAEVSRWLSELHDPQVTLDDALAGKARELTANATTELERIRAIGRYVQGIQYISIQIGLGRGGGMKPRTATQVFAKSYGDCKDKANLMRAMLKALRITAYPVAIYSGDPTYVREEWASPQQFNHCIIAIKISDETQVLSLVRHPTHGRLLIFDATDEHTPVGDLPGHEQGSLALLIAGDEGRLLRMPITPPEANRLERHADVVLTPAGAITAIVRERSTGHAATDERRAFRHLPRADYVKVIEQWITRGAPGAKLSKIDPTDSQAEGRFALDVEFTAERYAQSMQDRLLVFNPAIISRRDALLLTGGGARRQHPVVLEAEVYTEAVRIKLPDGFQVDETPEAVKLETSFGSYVSTYEVKDGHLLFTRSLVQRAATIPADQYNTVLDFFAHVRAAEQSPVVLAKK